VPAHRLLAVLAAVVTLWITEAIHLPVTALLGPVLCVLTGAFVPEAGTPPVKQVFRSFADPVIFLFLGSFLLAEAMLHHGLNRRIAFQILGLPGVGASPAKLLAPAFGIIHGRHLDVVSNTATTAMMFPIAMALLREMAGAKRKHRPPFGFEDEQVRDRADARHGVRGIGWRPSALRRHAAEPDWHRADRPQPGRQNLVLPLDVVWRAGRGSADSRSRLLPEPGLSRGTGLVAGKRRLAANGEVRAWRHSSRRNGTSWRRSPSPSRSGCCRASWDLFSRGARHRPSGSTGTCPNPSRRSSARCCCSCCRSASGTKPEP